MKTRVHLPRCDGACEGGAYAADEASASNSTRNDDQRTERQWATGLAALLGCWIVFVGISFGALLAWAWQAGLPGAQ